MRFNTDSAGFLPVILTFVAVIAAAPAEAHEIPSDVTVRLIVSPEPGRVNVLVRVPVEAMQEANLPETADGFLDAARAETALRDAAQLWLGNDLKLFANGAAIEPLSLERVRASIPSDRSFTDFASAAAHIRGPPIAPGTPLVAQQALLDARFAARADDPDADLALLADLDRLGLAVTTVVRFEPANGPARLYQLTGEPALLDLDPRWSRAALRFIALGFEHILGGLDHLLFLLCLVLPFRSELRSLLIIVTAFTVAHSITLIGSAFGLAPAGLWFPPLVETLIAASILYMCIENVLSPAVRMRWALAFGFGLVHGFGFSFALSDTLQFAGDHVLTSLLGFNIGVELGQIAVLAVLIPLLVVALRFLPERSVVILISVLVGHTAWHWMAERYTELAHYPAIRDTLQS